MDEEDEHSSCYFYYPKDLETFDVETQTGITECRIIKKLLTEFARAVLGAVLGNIGTRSWQTERSEVRTATTLLRSTVRPSRSVSRRLTCLFIRHVATC